jgi:hypothetical protein
MKLTAAILLILIVFSSLFYSGYFNALVFHAKEEAKEAMAEKNGSADLTIIKIPLKVNSSNADEIRFHGKLYDVVKREVIKDTVYEYLYHDENEENVLSEIGIFFKGDDNCFFPASSATPVLKGIHNMPNQLYTFYTSSFILKKRATVSLVFSEKKYPVLNKISKVPTPPPRFFSFLS